MSDNKYFPWWMPLWLLVEMLISMLNWRTEDQKKESPPSDKEKDDKP